MLFRSVETLNGICIAWSMAKTLSAPEAKKFVSLIQCQGANCKGMSGDTQLACTKSKCPSQFNGCLGNLFQPRYCAIARSTYLVAKRNRTCTGIFLFFPCYVPRGATGSCIGIRIRNHCSCSRYAARRAQNILYYYYCF